MHKLFITLFIIFIVGCAKPVVPEDKQVTTEDNQPSVPTTNPTTTDVSEDITSIDEDITSINEDITTDLEIGDLDNLDAELADLQSFDF